MMCTIETVVLYYDNGAWAVVVYYSEGKKVRYTKTFPKHVASFIGRRLGDKELAALMRRGWVSL